MNNYFKEKLVTKEELNRIQHSKKAVIDMDSDAEVTDRDFMSSHFNPEEFASPEYSPDIKRSTTQSMRVDTKADI